MTTMLTPEDLEVIKGRQQATWSSGDYAVIGSTLQLATSQNTATDGTLRVPSEYLEVVITTAV